MLDYLSAAAICATHLSRLGAELVLWSSDEFGFCEVADALGVGLVDHAAEEEPRRRRAAAGQGAADRRAPERRSTASCTALPLTYNKDLQEDKEHLFDAVDTLELSLAAATGMLAGIAFDRERLAAAASDELIAATDVADLLVRRGVPFRQSHGVVAGLVRDDAGGRPLAVRAVAGGARAPLAGARRRVLRACSSQRVVARVEGLRGRHRAAARARAAGARRAAELRAPGVNRAFYDRGVVEVARDLRRLRRCATARRRA